MRRIGLIGTTPLRAQGLLGALAGETDWTLVPMSGVAPADAYVVHAHDEGESRTLSASLPSGAAAVFVVDRLDGIDGRMAPEGRSPGPCALLGAHASPAQLRAALAAVLEGLSVHEAASPWPRTPADAAVETAGPGAAPVPAPPPMDHDPLTPRELEVFELLGKGLSNREIGGLLGISAHTAKYHVGQILAKVGAATRAEAVALGLRLGLIGL